MKRKLLFALMIALASTMVLTNCTTGNNNDDDDNDNNNNNGLVGLDAAKKDYQDNYVGTKVNTISWTGNEAACNSGDVSSNTRLKVVQRINYYRRMCGLPDDITLNSSQNKSCQDAALYMMANNTLTHFPASSGTCFTQDAYDAASTGNIAIGWGGSGEAPANHSINAVSGYMEDPGAGNEIVGHRAWLLCRSLSAVGTGSVYDANHQFTSGGYTYNGGAANCIRWGNNLNGNQAAGPEYICYPPANYVPHVLVFPRWHFAYPGADFSSASVTLTDNKGGSFTCNVIAREGQGGSLDARIVWEPQGLYNTDDNIIMTADTDYTVTVSGVQSAPQSTYTYTVKAFKVADADAKGKTAQKKLFL